MKHFITILLTVTLGVVAFSINNQEERFVKVANKTLPSTVSISLVYSIPNPFTGEKQKAVVSGAGVFITPEGHILTCAHLFTLPYKHKKLATIETYIGETVAGEIIAIDKKNDLALLRAPAISSNSYVNLADPRKLKVGQEVIAIGNPLGLDFTVTHGIISALYRDIEKNYNVTQHDVFINPGNSGGPVLNLKGELVGINSFMFSPIPFFPTFTGLGFSVQSGQCLEFLVYHGKTINPHRRYQWLKVLNDVKEAQLRYLLH